MSMNVHIAPYSVLRSTEELNSLADTWTSHNKERVYCKCALSLSARQGLTPVRREVDAKHEKSDEVSVSFSKVHGIQPPKTSVVSSINLATRCKPHVQSTRAPASPVLVAQPFISQGNQSKMKIHLNAMVLTEQKIIMIVADMFLKEASASSSTKLGGNSHEKDLSARSSCVSIIDTLHHKPLHVFIPVPPPTREQIRKCHDDSVYNNNLITNIVSALPAHLVKVVVSSGVHQDTHNTVYVDANRPVQVIGSAEVCNDLLFGDRRITSSPDFWLDTEMSNNYNAAVCKYQQYNNVGIGSNITLTPSYEKRLPLVLSFSCPEFKQTSVLSVMSACKSHPKYGPNHTTKIVEIMSKVAPFVRKCSEFYMNLTPDVQEQLLEDGYMPSATSENVQHCFCNDVCHGISAYVGKHSFTLPVGMLNTYVMETSESRGMFPMEKKMTIYVSAIYGGIPTEYKCEGRKNVT